MKALKTVLSTVLIFALQFALLACAGSGTMQDDMMHDNQKQEMQMKEDTMMKDDMKMDDSMMEDTKMKDDMMQKDKMMK